jgi:preprotein translocase subunit Sec61beta
LAYVGYSFYFLSIEERPFHPDYETLKSGGVLGHGFGVVGSLMIILGVTLYMIRKRIRRFSRAGLLKYWLEFHIFLCILGPVLVLYHTAFKFGGIVAISFWSMVAVVLSGVIGRYIYLQIPRTIEGQEMNFNEIESIKDELNLKLVKVYNLDESVLDAILQTVKKRPDRLGNNMLKRSIAKFLFERKTLKEVKAILRQKQISGRNFHVVIKLIKDEIALNRKIDRLKTMQNLFKYWHVAHLPFAILMLIIMIIHIIVTVTFGSRWIF